MVKGFLLVDGAKNVLLIHQDEMDMVGDMLNRISRKRDERIGDMVKTHKTNAELDKTIHAYLKCQFNDGCQEGVEYNEKHRNACGSCKYFEQAEITNKLWRKCQSVYKKGVHAGENRICYPSMNKCCDYVRKESNHDENN